jgi:hypothetical protein
MAEASKAEKAVATRKALIVSKGLVEGAMVSWKYGGTRESKLYIGRNPVAKGCQILKINDDGKIRIFIPEDAAGNWDDYSRTTSPGALTLEPRIEPLPVFDDR